MSEQGKTASDLEAIPDNSAEFQHFVDSFWKRDAGIPECLLVKVPVPGDRLVRAAIYSHHAHVVKVDLDFSLCENNEVNVKVKSAGVSRPLRLQKIIPNEPFIVDKIQYFVFQADFVPEGYIEDPVESENTDLDDQENGKQ